MISVIDYGVGNIGSVLRAFEWLNIPACLATTPEDILVADKLVLPGVGHAAKGMANLHERGLVDAIKKKAESGTPLLGICLGMQLLTKKSEEGETECLGLVDAEAVKFISPSEEQRECPTFSLALCDGETQVQYRAACRAKERVIESHQYPGACPGDTFIRVDDTTPLEKRIPHMGWNTVLQEKIQPIFTDIAADSEFYFAHSYYVKPGSDELILGRTIYQHEFASVIGTGNIIGAQFHPEKSRDAGMQLLKNFAGLVFGSEISA